MLFTNDLGLLYIDYIGSDRQKSVINVLSDQALFLKPHIHQSKCQKKAIALYFKGAIANF
ncbi:hypothetical protein GXM_00063 [Nostoc sphaeroides CCNUC1]|uniref:Uncharacterized protein n=1 Tax=Nostoc sphaeroides CCNUC1 TaxID=2653204 RepID=A0A5P8VQI2_9NOSO|nr:hypothetical protein GXM_00063 [Nostoc sphaeroides CCNUC1]